MKTRLKNLTLHKPHRDTAIRFALLLVVLLVVLLAYYYLLESLGNTLEG